MEDLENERLWIGRAGLTRHEIVALPHTAVCVFRAELCRLYGTTVPVSILLLERPRGTNDLCAYILVRIFCLLHVKLRRISGIISVRSGLKGRLWGVCDLTICPPAAAVRSVRCHLRAAAGGQFEVGRTDELGWPFVLAQLRSVEAFGRLVDPLI